MKKKFICTVCGYVYEGAEAPEKCPLCGAPRSKFKEMTPEAELQFVTEHEIGVAKGTGEEMITPAKKAPVFKAGKALKDAVNK